MKIEGNDVVFNNNFRIPKEFYSDIKDEFRGLLKDQADKDSELQKVFMDVLVAAGKVILPSSIKPFESKERPSESSVPPGEGFLDSAKREVTALNKRLSPGDGGGVIITSDHLEIKNTINGTVLVATDSVIDMGSLCKTAMRSGSEPLGDSVLSATFIALVERKCDA
jgi:hypothetical protein